VIGRNPLSVLGSRVLSMDADREVQFVLGGLRSRTLVRCRADANDLRLVRVAARRVRARHQHLLGAGVWRSVLGSTTFTEADLADAAVCEIAAATGLSLHEVSRSVAVADRLCGSMPGVVAALDAGRIDLARARTVAEAADGLTDAQLVVVERAVLAELPPPSLDGVVRVGPWDCLAPRAFTTMVRRVAAKVRQDDAEQVRADLRERTGTWVQVDPTNPAVATWTITGPTEQLVQLEETLGARVRSMTGDELAGRTHGMAKVDLLEDALTGGRDGAARGGVRRELGVVLHADTLFGDGPAAEDPGEVRGTGHPVPVTATTARVMAEDAQARGAGTCVLLAGPDGRLQRLLRLGSAPAGGWTRSTLVAATRRALERQPHPAHHTDAYAPTVEIADTVRARDPVCTFPGCGVPASRCDLDHAVPHPRGPTAVTNLGPRSRRCHRLKTAALWRCRTLLDRSGHVSAHEWTSPLGTCQVVEVTVLPGYARGEAYARA
jgi:hypothetical protein